jgi:hypothetical protein
MAVHILVLDGVFEKRRRAAGYVPQNRIKWRVVGKTSFDWAPLKM